MVKATVVGVEAVNAHGHVPILAFAVVRTLGIHHPIIAWCADAHLAGSRNEVCRELAVEYAVGILWVVETQRQVVVVELLAGPYLYLFREYHYFVLLVAAGIEHDVHTLRVDRRTLYQHLSTVGVAAGQQIVVEDKRSTLRIFALVSHVQFEASRLVERYIAHYGLVNPDSGLVGRNRSHVNHRTGLVPLRDAFLLVRFAGHTANGAEYEVREDGRCVLYPAQSTCSQTSAAYLVKIFVCQIVESVLILVVCKLRLRTIDIHCQARLA